MKATGVGQAIKGIPDSCQSYWAMRLLVLLVLPLFLPATEAGAAKITFEPSEISATAAPGEVVTVPVVVSLTETATANSYARFSVTSIDGNLDPSWINRQLYVSLDSLNTNRQVLFQLNVPADAKGGTYNRVFRTLWVRSNEQVAPADLVINVDVTETLACNQVPLFADISSTEDTINVRNNKEVTIDLSGTVSVPDGCDLVDARYQLTDEYGELDRTEPLTINDDGTFSVAVPMIASRKGKDKDGRLYTVKFMAKNEAGDGESPVISVVVLHDKRKKAQHENKKRRHESKKKGHDSKKSES